jgi:hypothetical protein
MFENAANGLFMALEAREPESAKESAAAIRALTYRAWTAEDPAVAQDALAKASTIANATLVDHDYPDVADQAAALAGLLSIASAQDSGEFRHAADAVFESMAADFDASNGVFISKDVYNVDEVAWIIGGLNSLVQQGSRDNKGAASDMLLAFYEATISLGGMQLSAPPGKNGVMAGEFEKDLPSVIFYHPANVPPPPMVGKLPVPAEEITWDGEDWQVTSDRLVTAGAMHLANELNWLGPISVQSPSRRKPRNRAGGVGSQNHPSTNHVRKGVRKCALAFDWMIGAFSDFCFGPWYLTLRRLGNG